MNLLVFPFLILSLGGLLLFIGALRGTSHAKRIGDDEKDKVNRIEEATKKCHQEWLVVTFQNILKEQ